MSIVAHTHTHTHTHTGKQMSIPSDPIPEAVISNIVCGFSIRDVRISIDALVKKIDACAYNSVKFAAATLRLKNPRCAALIFSSGSIVCPGTRTQIEALNAAWRYSRFLQKYVGIEGVFSSFDIKNVVSSAICLYQIFNERKIGRASCRERVLFEV